jgi:DNA repair protein RadA/Sms
MKINTQRGFDFGINVKDVVVPDMLRRRVPSGIDYLDGVFGGDGLTPSSVTMFTGTPGAGKTTMMLTLANGLVGRGAEVVFNTCEESLYQVKMHTERLGLKNGFKLGETQHVPTLLEQCDKLREAAPTKPFVLIVDSLQTVNDGFYKDGGTNSMTAVRALEMVTNWCKQHNTIGIVIGQVGKDGKFMGKNSLKHMVDAQLELSIDLKQKSPTFGLRQLGMSKNRFGGGSQQYWLQLEKAGFSVAAIEGGDDDE